MALFSVDLYCSGKGDPEKRLEQRKGLKRLHRKQGVPDGREQSRRQEQQRSAFELVSLRFAALSRARREETQRRERGIEGRAPIGCRELREFGAFLQDEPKKGETAILVGTRHERSENPRQKR